MMEYEYYDQGKVNMVEDYWFLEGNRLECRNWILLKSWNRIAMLCRYLKKDMGIKSRMGNSYRIIILNKEKLYSIDGF